MADDIVKEYLDKEGLTTYDKEIKKYALEKTSVEYNNEFTSLDNTGVVLLTIPMPEESDDVCSLVAIDLKMSLSHWVRYGKLVIMHRSGLVVAKIYGTTNELAQNIKYEWVELNKILYVKIATWNQLLLHVQASKNVGNITFEENSSKNLDDPQTPISVLQNELTELQDQINTLSGVVGGDSANFTPDTVLVASSDGKTITSNPDITVAELNCLNGVTTTLKNAAHITEGTLPVARGGTGKTSHTANAVLTGNSSSAVKNVATKSGAFYATDTNGVPKFGTLPVEQGGTGVTNLGTEGAILQAGPGGDTISSTPVSSGAFYCPSNSTATCFGVLPIAYGGTGGYTKKTARENLGLHMERIEINISSTAGGGFHLLPGLATFCVACIAGVALTSASLMNPALASKCVANITLFTSEYQLADEIKTGVFIYQNEKEDTDRTYFVDIFYILI